MNPQYQSPQGYTQNRPSPSLTPNAFQNVSLVPPKSASMNNGQNQHLSPMQQQNHIPNTMAGGPSQSVPLNQFGIQDSKISGQPPNVKPLQNQLSPTQIPSQMQQSNSPGVSFQPAPNQLQPGIPSSQLPPQSNPLKPLPLGGVPQSQGPPLGAPPSQGPSLAAPSSQAFPGRVPPNPGPPGEAPSSQGSFGAPPLIQGAPGGAPQSQEPLRGAPASQGPPGGTPHSQGPLPVSNNQMPPQGFGSSLPPLQTGAPSQLPLHGPPGADQFSFQGGPPSLHNQVESKSENSAPSVLNGPAHGFSRPPTTGNGMSSIVYSVTFLKSVIIKLE